MNFLFRIGRRLAASVRRLWARASLPSLEAISFFDFTTYLTCPAKFRFQREQPQKPSGQLAFFGIISRTLRQCYEVGQGKLCPPEELQRILEVNWNPDAFRDSMEEARFKEEGRALLRSFHERHSREAGSLWSETRDGKPSYFLARYFTAEIGGVKVRDRIDRAWLLPDGTVEVTIYRHGRRVSGGDVVEQDLRSVVLREGARRFFGHRRVRIVYEHLHSGRRQEVIPDKATARRLTRALQEAAIGIRLGEFEPNRSALCGWCDYRPSCPAWSAWSPQWAKTDDGQWRTRLSYSRLSQFLRCPRQFRFIYVDRVPPRPHSFFSLGTSVHEAFEVFYEYDGVFSRPGLGFLLRQLELAWRSEGYAEDGVDERTEHRKARRMLERYYIDEVLPKPWRPAYKVEEYFEFPLGRRVLMTGYIDRIDERPDGSYEVIDWKTEPMWPSPELMEDHKRQLVIYAIACERLKLTPKPPSELSLWMLAFHKKVSFRPLWKMIPGQTPGPGELDMEAEIRRLAEEADEAAARIQEAGRRYREDPGQADELFPPKENEWCHNCDFRHDCPVWADLSRRKEAAHV